MVAFCESPSCRRKFLLEYFGEVFNEISCNNCDNCLESRESICGTDIAKKIVSCILQLGERFGASHIADVLWGSRTRKVINNRHNALEAFGSGKEYSKAQWITFIRELTQLGCLSSVGDRYPVLKLTAKGHDILCGAESISLTKPEQDILIASKDSSKSFNRDLFECLRNLRSKLASEENVPPYIIFHDSCLKDMATRIPRSRSELRGIYGVGNKKLEKYGDHFLKEIDNYCIRNNIKSDIIMESVKCDSSTTNLANAFVENNQIIDLSPLTNDVEDWFYEHNRWSFKKHKLWNECKRAYYYNYIAPALKQIPEEYKQKLQALKTLKSRFSLEGILIHEVIGIYLSQRVLDKEFNKNDAKQYYAKMVGNYRKNARSRIIEYFNGDLVDESLFDSILTDGFSKIDLFFDKIVPELTGLKYLQHEKFDSFSLVDVGVTVKIDFLGRGSDGKLKLFDWKTGSDSIRPEYDLQLTSYILWAIQKYGLNLEDICSQLVFLKSGKSKIHSCSYEQIEEVKEIIINEFEEMNRTLDISYFSSSPSYGRCICCEFSTICNSSMYMDTMEISENNHTMETKTNMPSSPTKNNQAHTGDLLKNTFLLLKEIKSLQKQLNDLQDEYNMCIELAKTEGITRQGAYNLEKIVRKTRKVEAKAFREAYPDLFIELASVPVTAAERAVGREAMKKLVTYILRDSYIITKTEMLPDTSDRSNSSN